MNGKPVTVGVSKRLSTIIKTLDDCEFDLVVSLIDRLSDELESLFAEYPSALSAIARIHPYAFVCVRQSSSSNHWVVVEIYEDNDPDGPHTGGGGRFIPGYINSGVDSVFPALPQELRILFLQEVEEVFPTISCGRAPNLEWDFELYVSHNYNSGSIQGQFWKSFIQYQKTDTIVKLTLALAAAEDTSATDNKNGAPMQTASHKATKIIDALEAKREHDVQ